MSERFFTTPSALVNVMAKAAFKAAPALLRDFGELEKLQVSQKSPKDFVSNADKRSEKTLYYTLAKARPHFDFLLEETGFMAAEEPPQTGDEKLCWVVDPLDGTFNYLHGFPHFCISIAAMRGSEILAGLTYDCLRDEVFWAEKGRGAFLGKYRIFVSKRRLQDTLLVAQSHNCAKNLLKPGVDRHVTLRQTGSSALDLAYVAAGRLDAMVAHPLKLWDVAAGILFVQEARGAVQWPQTHKATLEGPVLACNAHVQLHDLFTCK
jgi:myo-inositol-1(or 4)-monophosphatase